jgi:hypothetical protein
MIPLEPSSSVRQYEDFYFELLYVLPDMLLRRNNSLLAKIVKSYLELNKIYYNNVMNFWEMRNLRN